MGLSEEFFGLWERNPSPGGKNGSVFKRQSDPLFPKIREINIGANNVKLSNPSRSSNHK